MKIQVKGYLTYKKLLAKQPGLEMAPGSTIQDLLDRLSLDSDQSKGIALVLVNGKHCRHLPDRLATLLKDGDEVAIFPPMAGG
ncbi:MAG: MoaD/ThiS family protein [Chloroflexi bacterium]|nr:MoaD/ThiS family protein [Chloroflexota bacterium]